MKLFIKEHLTTHKLALFQRKCDMYWPKEGAETYGIIQVRLVEELIMSTYTIRTFAIRNIKMKKVLIFYLFFITYSIFHV